MINITESPIIKDIPDPSVIRARIAQIANERAMLRALLRLAKRKEEAGNNLRHSRAEGGCDAQ